MTKGRLGKIPEEFIQTLLARVDIVDIVSPRVKLRKQGANHMGCCPFHGEKTASFSVSQAKQFYYCFGCGASGNALGFLMAFDQLTFVEAVEELAHVVGMEVPRLQSIAFDEAKADQIEVLYEVLEKAAAFYESQLKTHPQREEATTYLKNRGLTGQLARQYRLGYAPEGWSTLSEALGASSENQKKLLEAGLLIRHESGKCYDRFRRRIMFPIRNRRGRVVGFGARAMNPEDQPKYLNSPETPVFHKGSELYGFYELRQHKGVPARILVTEGYMDVLALAQFDFWYAVAALGTATSKTHVETLLKQTRHLIFCFDGDRAGREAAWRALEVTLPLMTGDFSVEFLFLPEEHDPDSFIRQFGVEAFEKALGGALPLSAFFLQHLKEGKSLESVEWRAQFVRSALPYLQKIPAGPYLDLLINEVAKIAQLETSQIRYGLAQKAPGTSEETLEARSHRDELAPLDLIEYLLSWLLQYPELASSLDFSGLEKLSPAMDVFIQVADFFKQHPKGTVGMLLSQPLFQRWENWLATLSVFEHQLTLEAALPEIRESIEKLKKEHDENQLNALIEKSRMVPLTVEEKQKIESFLRKSKA